MIHSPILLSATATALAVWFLTELLNQLWQEEQTVNSIERRRREKLAQGSFTYHWLGGFFRSMSRRWLRLPESMRRKLALHLSRSGCPLPWREEEWFATTLFSSALGASTLAMAWVMWLDGGRRTVIVLPAMAILLVWLTWRRLSKRAVRRMGQIRGRLPFVIDSVGLSMEAGASFQESLAMAVDSCPGTPIGQELSFVVADVQRGRSMAEALKNFKRRMQDPTIDEFIMAGKTSHQLGSAMSGILLGMSKRIRDRRCHEIESAAGRAQIKLYYPAMILLVVCLLAVVAPFAFPMWDFLTGNFA